jgi:hypothetical protein
MMSSLEARVDGESITLRRRAKTLDGRARFRRSENFLWRSFADEVLLSGADSEFRTLVGTAAHVWSLLREPMSPEDIAAQLARVYRAPFEVITRDVTALLRELKNLGYVDEVTNG